MTAQRLALRDGLRRRPRASSSSTRARSIWPRASRPSTRCAPRRAGSISPPATALGERLENWADEIADIVRERGGGNMRLAVDKLEPLGVDALRERGITLVEGQELTEHARAIKSPEELELMRWTIRVCEAGMARMYEHSRARARPSRRSGPNCTTRTSAPAASGSRRGSSPPARAPIRGSRSARTTCCRDGRHARLRHRHDRPVRLLRRPVALLDHRPYAHDAASSASSMRPRSSRSTTTSRSCTPGMSFARIQREVLAHSGEVPALPLSSALHGVGMADEWPSVPLHVDFARAYAGGSRRTWWCASRA